MLPLVTYGMTGIHHPQAREPVYPYCARIDDRQWARAHRAGAGGMQRGLAVTPDPVEHLLGRVDIGTGRQLARVVRVHGRLAEDRAGDADRLNPFPPVL